MPKYTINLFGNNIECELQAQDGKLEIKISEEKQEALKSYIARALSRYGHLAEGEAMSFHELICKSIEVEKNLGGRMSEPTVKLPYEFAPETKEKLIEAASLQDISATQLLIRIIESKYKSVFDQ
ncbi:hypothetical protein NDS46_29100 [Paenibacillus thiaminolyticus]|uniref:hypothetical protein n=1 Tax=Paenibacillus thiaminolyticus TaxID=49283 RepID=UPI00232A9C74|nr:hypothetical protein [Paenibacillus thiaminolyticus]WCF08263.1 hypothetical protein NDS46_29100 [Paenibacillus thiaminolyticus]